MYIRQVLLALVLGAIDTNEYIEPVLNTGSLFSNYNPNEEQSRKLDKKPLVKEISGDGVVIDHLPPDTIPTLLSMLQLNTPYAVGSYCETGKEYLAQYGYRKGILKISDRDLTPDELNKVALVAPNATITWIKGGKKDMARPKSKVEIPDIVEGVGMCEDSKCVSRPEKNEGVLPRFRKVDGLDGLVECYYCDTVSRTRSLIFPSTA